MTKYYEITGIGKVAVRKSRRAKRLMIRIKNDGKPEVVLPFFTPYHIGKIFAVNQTKWIIEHQETESELLYDGQVIGRYNRLYFNACDSINTKVITDGADIVVNHHKMKHYHDKSIQLEAYKASSKALRAQAKDYLPKRLHYLSKLHMLSYNKVSIRNTSTRWGSCSKSGNISLNMWLMTLPDDLIEYVIIHELAHLKHHNHSRNFWSLVESMHPEHKESRALIKQSRPGTFK